MYALGFDIGSSSIKCAIIDCESGGVLANGFAPSTEMAIASPRPGWAEQDPDMWWRYAVELTRRLVSERNLDPGAIGAIGISYQMHGLVLVDSKRAVLRPSIIWCDSRAVNIGKRAWEALGESYCLSHLLNSPGNFTASKLRWVKEEEPDVFSKIHKAMLPGDFIAMKLTGEISTTISGLSEGMYWDFAERKVSSALLEHYGIDGTLMPDVHPTFSVQGRVTAAAAAELGIREGIPVSYRAGDQPNNAFSLRVFEPGEVAATAGTSGVVYGVIDKAAYDSRSRVNPFAHVNYAADRQRLGVLLCINGTGILNSWLRKNVAAGIGYEDMNARAAGIPIGSDGVVMLPFGNGAERMLENRNVGCHVFGLDLNRHSQAHLLRAAQEGIAFAFKYGIDIMTEMGMKIAVIRAGHTNMFLSPVFRQTLADVAGVRIQLYDTDGAQGAARGAAVGAGLVESMDAAFGSLRVIDEVVPSASAGQAAADAFAAWHARLQQVVNA